MYQLSQISLNILLLINKTDQQVMQKWTYLMSLEVR